MQCVEPVPQCQRFGRTQTGTYLLLNGITGEELLGGSLSVGPGTPFDVDVSGVSRVRLFMNDPNSPSQACGFERVRTVLVWGDAELRR